MAEVYLARKDGDLVDRDLVVKRMLPHLAEDARFVQLFLREARIAARLSHPNVVHVLDVGQSNDEFFIAMEFLEGLSALQLAKRVWTSGRSLPISVVAQIICDAALGLQHAHTLLTEDGRPGDLVHRDISPDNLLVTATGATKVLDFGIAAGAFAGRVTRTGEIKGKIRYMSPEQLAGEDLDARTDVFALGVTLYWLLTGRHAFNGKSDMALMRAVVESDPPAPSTVNPHVPHALDAIVARMLMKARADRMASAEAVYEALSPFAGTAGMRRAAELVAIAMELPEPQPKTDGQPEAETTPIPQAATVGVASGLWAAATDDDAKLPTAGSSSFDLVKAEPSKQTSTTAPPVDAPDPDGTPTRSGVAVLGGALLEATVREAAKDAPSEATRASHERTTSGARGAGNSALVESTLADDGTAQHDLATPRSSRAVAAGAGVVVAAFALLIVWVTRDSDQSAGKDDTALVVDSGATQALPAEVRGGPLATDAGPAPLVGRDLGDAGDVGDGPEVAPSAASRGPRRVVVRAPSHVKWTTRAGALLGRGNDTLMVPAGTARVHAIDGELGGRVSVAAADRIDWAKLPRGELSFIVLPWADVAVGGKTLGRTPRVGPISVVAGHYEVVLTYGTRFRKVKVEVPAGGSAIVRESFLD